MARPELHQIIRNAVPKSVRAIAPGFAKRAVRAPFEIIDNAMARFDLENLGRRHRSDKYLHGYLANYKRHLARFRDRPVTLLEIGIGGYDNPNAGGDSLRLWAAYFTKGQIHGVDIYDKSAHDAARITTHCGSQVDAEFLTSLVDKIGRPDIIVDDGSHLNEHVRRTFEILFPLLADDGVYIIEDMQTAYFPQYGGSYADLDSPSTSVQFMRRLFDAMNYQYIPHREASVFDGWIKSVSVYPKAVVIQKSVLELPIMEHDAKIIEEAASSANS